MVRDGGPSPRRDMLTIQDTRSAERIRPGAAATLRCDFHLHTSDDPFDRIRHDVLELLDRAAGLGFHVVAVTNHLAVTRREDAEDHARSLGMLLLTGVELTIKGRHVLFINPPGDLDPDRIRDFEDLRGFRREESLVIPAHPFYPGPTHFGDELERHADLWDGVELCHFYLRGVDFNRRSREVADRLRLPLVATSDTHALKNMGTACTEIALEDGALVDALSIARAVRAGNLVPHTRPLGLLEAARMAWNTFRTVGTLPAPPGHRRDD